MQLLGPVVNCREPAAQYIAGLMTIGVWGSKTSQDWLLRCGVLNVLTASDISGHIALKPAAALSARPSTSRAWQRLEDHPRWFGGGGKKLLVLGSVARVGARVRALSYQSGGGPQRKQKASENLKDSNTLKMPGAGAPKP